MIQWYHGKIEITELVLYHNEIIIGIYLFNNEI